MLHHILVIVMKARLKRIRQEVKDMKEQAKRINELRKMKDDLRTQQAVAMK